MKNYAIELLETALRNELIARNNALLVINGSVGYYSEATLDAFKQSQALAQERIPQLTQALNAIKEQQP